MTTLVSEKNNFEKHCIDVLLAINAFPEAARKEQYNPVVRDEPFGC